MSLEKPVTLFPIVTSLLPHKERNSCGVKKGNYSIQTIFCIKHQDLPKKKKKCLFNFVNCITYMPTCMDCQCKCTDFFFLVF